MYLKIYRNSAVNLTVQIDENTVLTQKFYGENQITCKIKSRDALDLAIGDKTYWIGMWYIINTMPSVIKNASNDFEYTIIFESEYFNLAKVQYLSNSSSEFDLITDVAGFIDLMVENLNRVYGSGVWSRGTCDQTDTSYKNIHFSAQNCREVIQVLCSEFDGELYFNRHEICFTDELGSDSGLSFQYRAGLYNITRETSSSTNIVTRLYAFGSEINLGTSYRSGKTRLEFDDYPNEDMEHRNYLSKNTDLYGIIEHTEIFEDIYPHRDGTVTSVDGSNELIFYDSGIDFDINSYLISGVSAKVHFNTGNLAGYEFEISAFDYSTKKFTLIAMKPSENEDELPNSTLKPAVNDTYVVLDITMPSSYITTAENELQTKAQAFLDKNCSPHLKYTMVLDPRYMRLHSVNLKIADKITIVDEQLNTSALLRITELSYPLNDQYAYTLSVADYVDTSLTLKIYDTAKTTAAKVTAAKVGNINTIRQSWRTFEELKNMVFDPDGYFTDAIRPLSIETSMLEVGAKSTLFNLSGVIIEPNLLGNPANINITAGSLIHFSILDTITTWTLQSNSYTGLDANTAYYIYARCSKTDTESVNNKVIVEVTQRTVGGSTTYYYFLIGILHSVVNGVRAISLTYGQTLINGKHITTGKISSADGNTYFDLDNNTLVIGNASGLGNFTDAGALATLDTISATECDTTIISGGKIITGLLTADNIQAGTFTGRTFRTATSGQRVLIDASNNNMTFYNSSGAAVVIIDDGDGGYLSVGDLTGYNVTWLDQGVVRLYGSGTGELIIGNYWDGTAWLTSTFYITTQGKASFSLGVYVPPSSGFYVNNTKVLGAQGAAVANATSTSDIVAQFNTLLSRLRSHGIIAT